MINNIFFGVSGGLIIDVSTDRDAYLIITRDMKLIHCQPIATSDSPELCQVDIVLDYGQVAISLETKQHDVLDRVDLSIS